MVAGCATNCVKYIFFTLNLLFCVFGALILGLAIWLRFDNAFQLFVVKGLKEHNVLNLANLQMESYYVPLYVLMAIGAVMFVTGFLGCCGAWCENVCLLGVFFTIVLVLFLVQIAGAIFIYVKKDAIREDFAKAWKKHFTQEAIKEPEGELAKSLAALHKEFKCCGAFGCEDYVAGAPAECAELGVCKEPGDHSAGCAIKLIDTVQDHWQIAIIVLAVVLFIELLAMIFCCCLCSGIRSNYYEYY